MRTKAREECLAGDRPGQPPFGAHKEETAEALGDRSGPGAGSPFSHADRERAEQFYPDDCRATKPSMVGWCGHNGIVSPASRARTGKGAHFASPFSPLCM